MNVTCNVIATERNEHENKQIKHRVCGGISWHILASRRLRADGGKPGGFDASPEAAGKLKVAVTLFPYYDFVRQIAGDQVDPADGHPCRHGQPLL
ncbi:MAG: hypothetical protein ACLUD2_19310 [Clostridium sp.]